MSYLNQLFSNLRRGLVPVSGGLGQYLREDGTWAAPAVSNNCGLYLVAKATVGSQSIPINGQTLNDPSFDWTAIHDPMGGFNAALARYTLPFPVAIGGGVWRFFCTFPFAPNNTGVRGASFSASFGYPWPPGDRNYVGAAAFGASAMNVVADACREVNPGDEFQPYAYQQDSLGAVTVDASLGPMYFTAEKIR